MLTLINNRDVPVQYQLGSWPEYSQIAAKGKIDFLVGSNESIRFAGMETLAWFKGGSLLSQFSLPPNQWEAIGDRDTIIIGTTAIGPDATVETVTTQAASTETAIPADTTTAPERNSNWWWWLLIIGGVYMVTRKKKGGNN